MALYQSIRQDDGVITNYHRILFLDLFVNSHNSVAVLSYTDDSARMEEKESTMENGEPFKPYQKAITYETDYDPEMMIEAAYRWLKTLPPFAGAEDV